ncbi:MAG: redoxin domain-containing protein [Rubripirellula sp.]
MNCVRNYPWYKGWEKEFRSQDFTLLGVHSPETEAERDPDNVRKAVQKEGFQSPVIIDKQRKTWFQWGNNMWPAVYLIDKQGRIRYWWFGELNWKEAGGQKLMERRIKELIAENE